MVWKDLKPGVELLSVYLLNEAQCYMLIAMTQFEIHKLKIFIT